MIFDRQKQRLLLEGREYTPDDISRLLAEGENAYPSAIRDLFLFLREWFNDSPFMKVHTSGSTGTPKELTVRKEQMMQSARLTCEFLNLQPGDKALLCMNLRYIGAMMVVVRSLIAGLNLFVRPATGHPLADINESLKFAAMVPLQVYNTLQVSVEKERLQQTDILIIGGGAVDSALEAEIKRLPGAVYSTYGMTETLSHIALRRLNGASASEHYYPFSSVRLSLSLQVYNTLQVSVEKERLQQTDILIIGGGAVDSALEAEIKRLPGAVYSTYGMTETLSHIALRRLNGASASEHYYPFSSVRLSLSSENTLVIEAPLVCDEVLQTNDMARIYSDGSFMILGRKDNVINSGGIKIQAEEMEKRLQSLIDVPFVITSVPDRRLGQAVTLLIEGRLHLTAIEGRIQAVLEPYYRPKYIRMVNHIPRTENGKINRAECRILAQNLHLGGKEE